MIRRTLTLLHARNLEFIRDRSALAWNLLFPVLLVFGLGFVFSGDGKPIFKVALLSSAEQVDTSQHPFLTTPHIDFFTLQDEQKALDKVARHQIDLLLSLKGDQHRYWINSDSSKGELVERLLLASGDRNLQRGEINGREVRYVDWLVPGILGMNIMFSCLFGIGFVIVRYRKSGYLKRLNATPLLAIEFLVAQVISRLILLLGVTVLVYFGSNLILGFTMNGSYWALLLITALGIFCMITLGLIIAARTSSEELSGGLLNLISWPMMVLSGVWFSLEGTPKVVQIAAEFFPLTHLLSGARAIMLDGAGLAEIRYQLVMLTLMSLLFLGVGAAIFRWRAE